MTRKLRFRILFPILILLVSIALDKAGDSQRTKLVQANTGRYGYREDLPAQYAIARFVGYGINAPAWALSTKVPFVVPETADLACCGFIKSEQDWAYFIGVVAMWYIIGAMLDKRRAASKPARLGWLRAISSGGKTLYGGFLLYSGVRFYQPPWNYPRWFVVPIALWGMALIIGGIFPPLGAKVRYWYVILGGFVITAGAFYIEAGVELYRYRAFFGMGSVTLLFASGAAAVLMGMHMVKLSARVVRETTFKQR